MRGWGYRHPSLWATIQSIAPKMGRAPQTLNNWIRQHERDTGQREVFSISEREIKKIRQAPAYFAQVELDPRTKT